MGNYTEQTGWGGGVQPFVLTSGAGNFGSWVQILGSDDTPIATGKQYYDPAKILVVATSIAEQFVIQFVSGESSGIAAKIAAEDFSEAMYIAAATKNYSGITEVGSPRIQAGEKLWARSCWMGGSGSGATISFYFDIHEYIR